MLVTCAHSEALYSIQFILQKLEILSFQFRVSLVAILQYLVLVIIRKRWYVIFCNFLVFLSKAWFQLSFRRTVAACFHLSVVCYGTFYLEPYFCLDFAVDFCGNICLLPITGTCRVDVCECDQIFYTEYRLIQELPDGSQRFVDAGFGYYCCIDVDSKRNAYSTPEK